MERHDTGVTFIGVPNASDGSDADKQAFIDGMSTQISHVLDDPESLWVEYQVSSQPAMIFIAPDGTTERHIGSLGPQRLLERAEALAAS